MLFSPEKERFVKIMNGIFIIWIMAALLVMASGVIDLLIVAPEQTYEQYRSEYCYFDDEDAMTEDECKQEFKMDLEMEDEKYYSYREIAGGAANVVVVSIALVVINFPKRNKAKPTKAAAKKLTKK